MIFPRQDQEFVRFVVAVNDLETGHHTGLFQGRRYGVTVERPVDGRVTKLFAQELGGQNVVSFNLYAVGDDQWALKPCEMSADKVKEFVLHFEPDRREEDGVFTIAGT